MSVPSVLRVNFTFRQMAIRPLEIARNVLWVPSQTFLKVHSVLPVIHTRRVIQLTIIVRGVQLATQAIQLALDAKYVLVEPIILMEQNVQVVQQGHIPVQDRSFVLPVLLALFQQTVLPLAHPVRLGILQLPNQAQKGPPHAARAQQALIPPFLLCHVQHAQLEGTRRVWQ